MKIKTDLEYAEELWKNLKDEAKSQFSHTNKKSQAIINPCDRLLVPRDDPRGYIIRLYSAIGKLKFEIYRDQQVRKGKKK